LTHHARHPILWGLPPPEPTGAPKKVGRYEVISHLATGGMAQIYLARQSGLGAFERHVVLKTILRERATDQRFITMFLDEAKLAATLNHQNIAQVFEVDQADGALYMAMEYVHGENARAILETTLRRGWTIPLELAVMIVSGAAAGLHHAHERHGKNGQPLNIVHRDVSPANIMVGYDGSVKVLDFGIAKAEERATKTVGGTIKGKYGYMSPEQCKGKPIDRRSDIFALGICLYELTTLRRAFKGNDDFETMKRIVAGDVILPSVAVPGYPRELEAIVLTAMANDVNARFQTAQEMIEALDAFTVRAKLVGSNTAMGRFMTQLFGSKKEPWVESAAAGLEKTAVSEVDVRVTGRHEAMDDDKTAVIDGGQEEAPSSARAMTAPLAMGRPVTAPPAARTTPMPSAAPQDAAAWETDSQRAPSRRSSPHMENRAPAHDSMPPEIAGLDTTLAGPGVIPRRPDPQRLGATGPRPAIRAASPAPGMVYAAPAPDAAPSRRPPPWVILMVLMTLALIGGIAIAMQSSGSPPAAAHAAGSSN
jgi:serine/threonine protein kinase